MLHRLSLLLLLLCSAIVAPATLRVFSMEAWGILRSSGTFGDGYVKVYCNNYHIGTTQLKKNSFNPVWTEQITYENVYSGYQLKLKMYDRHLLYDDLLGICETTIMFGDYKHTCRLSIGGQLKYRYSLH